MKSSDIAYNKVPLTVEQADATALPEREAPLTGKERNLQGWRVGVVSGVAITSTVLLLNICITAWAVGRHGGADENGQVTLFEGDCELSRRYNIAAHLLINILSTGILGASNYAMQCLSAPTRPEIDAAHARRKWMDIGVPSLRNLGRINRKRLLLWLLLALSSLPLHLFYNSAVYAGIAANDYYIFFAGPETLSSKSSEYAMAGNVTEIRPLVKGLYEKALSNELISLSPKECIDTYAKFFVTNYRHLILTTDNKTIPPNPHYYDTYFLTVNQGDDGCPPMPFEWMCSGDQDWMCYREASSMSCSNKVKSLDPNDWRPFGQQVTGCLVEPVVGQCKLRFSQQLAIIIIVFNAIKATILACIFFGIKGSPLVTIGDAVTSFLKRPDETTKGWCLMSKRNCHNWVEQRSTVRAVKFDNKKKSWSSSISGARWWVCMFIFLAAIVTCAIFLFIGVSETLRAEKKERFNLAFGVADPRAFIYATHMKHGPSTFYQFVFMANVPQVLLSLIYFSYNGIFTTFMLGYEWSGYSQERKGLRVSTQPKGAQRSTYFLQLPYRVALPLMVLSGILHWLCSQAIFFVNVEILRMQGAGNYGEYDDTDGQIMGDIVNYLTCGYSPRAILVVIGLGCGMLIVLVATGMLKYKGAMPIAGSCSAAMSAACHIPRMEDHEQAVLMPLKWGETSSEWVVERNAEVGHCSFSAGEVLELTQDKLYAGSLKD